MPTGADIAEYLEDQSVGTVGTDIFVNYMPADVNNCIGVFETTGLPPEKAVDIDHPGIQIRVRNTSQSTAETKRKAVYDALNGLIGTTIETRLYYSIWALGSPMALGQDDQRRFQYTQNYQIMKDRE